MASFSLDNKFSISCEGIEIPSTEGLFPYMKRKMAERYYKERGYSVIDGDDFEHNMLKLFAKEETWRAIDKYSKVKIGRNPASVAGDYCRSILELFSKEEAAKLLYACRFSSYLGGPGFPELIAHKESDMLFVYVGSRNELLATQKMFAILCILLNIKADFALFDVSEKPILQALNFTLNEIIAGFLGNPKVQQRLETVSVSLEKAKNAELQMHALYWENEKAKLPFPLFAKWKAEGRAEEKDLEKNIADIASLGAEMMALFERMKEHAGTSPEFAALGDKQDEGTLRLKGSYFMEKFGINEHTAKDFLTYLMFG